MHVHIRIEGSGITGAFITLLLYLGSIILSMLLLYEYLVHVHRDGRILDIWRRINAPAEEFFLPHDFEVSKEELLDVVHKARHWKGPMGYRRVLITRTEPADITPGTIVERKFYIIQEIEPNGRRSIFRQFYREESTGCIIEIFKEVDSQSSSALRPRAIFDNEKALQQATGGGSGRTEPRSQKAMVLDPKSDVNLETVGSGNGDVVESPLHTSVDHVEGSDYGSHRGYADEPGDDEEENEGDNEEDEDLGEDTALLKRK